MIDRERTYLQMIQNSLGTKMFRNVYVDDGQGSKDILNNGELSCAVYVSAVLLLNALIERPHATVSSLERTMKQKGWQTVPENQVKAGDIIVWEHATFSAGDAHRHIGFYIGKGVAISNHYEKGYPVEHDWKKDNRGVEKIYRPIL